ncbi:ABC transporter permease [Microbacterium halotolerans]|uniref:ABC transporter permease n=1 Tax=Microbacterium halotolerans TaxID=246613 RepID=UPI000E6A9698|nr:ABC transporter permease [Microbacterium halotolerans]
MTRALFRSPTGLIGLTSLTLLVLTAVVSWVWTPHDPLAVDPAAGWLPFSPDHPLGTDSLGRDQLSSVLVGARVTLVATLLATGIAAFLGIIIAIVLSIVPPTLSAFLQRLVDVSIAFPTLIVAIILVTGFGASTLIASISIGLSASVIIARTVLPELRRAQKSDFVLLARAAGAGRARILRVHVLPAIAPTFIVRTSQVMASAALAEAGLSYLGFGTPPPTPSWGRSLADLQSQILTRPEYLIAPALAIVIVVVGLNLLGDALRDGLLPRAHRTRTTTPSSTDPSRKATVAS